MNDAAKSSEMSAGELPGESTSLRPTFGPCAEAGLPPTGELDPTGGTGNMPWQATARVTRKNRMTSVPSGTELARPFIPAKDFDLSKRFYIKLGFEKVLDSDVAVFRIGSTGFILQPFDRAENFMMQLMVDDLDAWWAHINALDLENEFGVPAPRAPAMQPWGLRIAYVVDPSGVLWHVAQRRPGKPQDV
jgi:catechol 2,3-dioxygenase-like lactoylglutathione lyase family enzyme